MLTASFGSETRKLGDEECVVAVAGEIDMFTSPGLRRDLFDAVDKGATRVVVDLSDVTLLDSTALAVLVEALRRLRASDGSLVLVVTDDHLRKVLRITGLDLVFPVYGSVRGATASMDSRERDEGGSDG